jgi:hypothetical protein
MADSTLKVSGYLASEAAIVFAGTQQLDSLADNEWTDLSNEIDNSTNKYERCDLRVDLASITPTGTDAGLEIYLVPTVDGTTYPTWTGNSTSDAQENQAYYVGFVPLKAAAQAQDGVLMSVALPNGKYKWGVRNRANVALAADAGDIYWRPWGYLGDEA